MRGLTIESRERECWRDRGELRSGEGSFLQVIFGVSAFDPYSSSYHVSVSAARETDKSADEVSDLRLPPPELLTLHNHLTLLLQPIMKRKDSCAKTSVLFLSFSLCCKTSQCCGVFRLFNTS